MQSCQFLVVQQGPPGHSNVSACEKLWNCCRLVFWTCSCGQSMSFCSFLPEGLDLVCVFQIRTNETHSTLEDSSGGIINSSVIRGHKGREGKVHVPFRLKRITVDVDLFHLFEFWCDRLILLTVWACLMVTCSIWKLEASMRTFMTGEVKAGP